MKIRKDTLKRSKPEDVQRLARWLRLRDTEQMSHNQRCALINWLFTRREKRERGFIL